MKIGIIGHFGGNKVFLDGQTIKTKEINKYLEDYYKIKTDKIDTYKNKYNLFKMIYLIIKILKNNDIIIVILSIRGYKIITPILMFFNIFYKRRLFDIVIGKRYHIYKNNNIISRLSRKYEKIFIETSLIKKEYIKRNICNVEILNNFKRLNKGKVHITKNKIRLCTFSRVIKEKGINEAIEAIIKVNKRLKKDIFVLDIYGVISDSYKEEFNNIINNSPNYIEYKGEVDYNKSVDILNNYDVMLFLTYYKNEGFPGTIIDAFYAGLPVIATKWNSNLEVLKDNYTGLLVDINNIDQVVDKLIYLYNNKDILNKMKENCLKESDKYNPDKVMKVLINIIEE